MNENTQSPTTIPTQPSAQCRWEECVDKLHLDENTDSRVRQLITQLEKGEVDESTVEILSHAVNRNEELKNAETEGYLRGRNEKIEQATHPMPIEEPAPEPATFPRYNRRSVWDR